MESFSLDLAIFTTIFCYFSIWVYFVTQWLQRSIHKPTNWEFFLFCLFYATSSNSQGIKPGLAQWGIWNVKNLTQLGCVNGKYLTPRLWNLFNTFIFRAILLPFHILWNSYITEVISLWHCSSKYINFSALKLLQYFLFSDDFVGIIFKGTD